MVGMAQTKQRSTRTPNDDTPGLPGKAKTPKRYGNYPFSPLIPSFLPAPLAQKTTNMLL